MSSQSDIIDLTPSSDENDDDHDTDDASSSYNSVWKRFLNSNSTKRIAIPPKTTRITRWLWHILSESETNHDHATATRMPPPPPRRRQQRRGKTFRCGIGLEDLRSKPGRVTPFWWLSPPVLFGMCLSDLIQHHYSPKVAAATKAWNSIPCPQDACHPSMDLHRDPLYPPQRGRSLATVCIWSERRLDRTPSSIISTAAKGEQLIPTVSGGTVQLHFSIE